MASVPVEVTDSVPSPEDDEDEEGDKHDEEDEAAGGDEEEEEEEILDGSRNMDGSTKSFICTHPGCGKVFQKNCNLIQHTRVHTGERPFMCDEPGCGKSFGQSGNLTKHKNSHRLQHLKWNRHTREKPFKCRFPGCTKSFTAKSSLQVHWRAHTLAGSPMAFQVPPDFLSSSAPVAAAESAEGLTCPHPGCGFIAASADALAEHTDKYSPNAAESPNYNHGPHAEPGPNPGPPPDTRSKCNTALHILRVLRKAATANTDLRLFEALVAINLIDQPVMDRSWASEGDEAYQSEPPPAMDSSLDASTSSQNSRKRSSSQPRNPHSGAASAAPSAAPGLSPAAAAVAAAAAAAASMQQFHAPSAAPAYAHSRPFDGYGRHDSGRSGGAGGGTHGGGSGSAHGSAYGSAHASTRSGLGGHGGEGSGEGVRGEAQGSAGRYPGGHRGGFRDDRQRHIDGYPERHAPTAQHLFQMGYGQHAPQYGVHGAFREGSGYGQQAQQYAAHMYAAQQYAAAQAYSAQAYSAHAERAAHASRPSGHGGFGGSHGGFGGSHGGYGGSHAYRDKDMSGTSEKSGDRSLERSQDRSFDRSQERSFDGSGGSHGDGLPPPVYGALNLALLSGRTAAMPPFLDGLTADTKRHRPHSQPMPPPATEAPADASAATLAEAARRSRHNLSHSHQRNGLIEYPANGNGATSGLGSTASPASLRPAIPLDASKTLEDMFSDTLQEFGEI